MGGGAEKKKTNAMLAEDRARSQKQDDAFQGRQESRGDTAYAHGEDLYGKLSGAYGDMMGGGGGWGGGGAAGPAALSAKYGDVENFYKNSMGKEGGYDATRVASMDENIGQMNQFGKMGASSAENAARMRGGGVYDEFAKTGGVSDAEAYGMRDRATRSGRAMYTAAQDQLGRDARASGGAPNGAVMSRMARQGAQSANQSQLDAETGIAGMRREGRLAGAAGMSSTEQQVANNQQMGMGNAFAAQKGVAEGIRSGQQYGNSGMEGLAQMETSRNQQAADAAASNAASANSMRMAGLYGLSNLRGDEMGAEQNYATNQLRSRGMYGDQAQGQIDQRITNNPQHSVLDYVNAATNVAGAVMTGGASLGVKALASKGKK